MRLNVFGVTRHGFFLFISAKSFVDFTQKNYRQCRTVRHGMIKIKVKIIRARRLEKINAVKRLADYVVRLRQIFFYQREFLIRPLLDYHGHYFAVKNLANLQGFGMYNKSTTENVVRVQNGINRIGKARNVNQRRQLK